MVSSKVALTTLFSFASQVHGFNVALPPQHKSFCSIPLHLSTPTLDPPMASPSNEDKNDEAALFSNTDGRVSATADFISFVSSPNGCYGIMAIKLREEDTIRRSMDEVSEVKENPESGSGMFGGGATKAAKAMAEKAKNAIKGDDFTGKTVLFPEGKNGVIVSQRPPMAFVMCDFASYDSDAVPVDSVPISILSTRYSIPVSDSLFGSSIDCQAKPLGSTDDEGVDEKHNTSFCHRAIFAPIPQIKDIALINAPLLTGTVMIDALAPIGKGQNMLIVGQKGVGQRDVAIGMLEAQKGGKVKCVYALTTSDPKEREEVKAKMEAAGVLENVVLVTMKDYLQSSEVGEDCPAQAAEAIGVAATACSIGEAYALAKGEDSLVIVDDISQHKTFWDWTTKVLVEVYGVDAVVKDDADGGASSEMRAFYSNLVQRAGRFKNSIGGGSMTLVLLTSLDGQFGNLNDDGEEEHLLFTAADFAQSSDKIKERIAILVNKNIPLTQSTLRKIKIPSPASSLSEKKRRIALAHTDDLISMSDGQIWLDEQLYLDGQRPAMDPQRSVTRVGIGADTPCRADAPAMRGLAGGLRFDLAQANSLEGAGANSGAEKLLLKKQSYLLAMHQDSISGGRTLSENCVALLAASTGSLTNTIEEGGTAGTEKGNGIVRGLLEHVWTSAPDTMAEIDTSLDLTDDARTILEETIFKYFQ